MLADPRHSCIVLLNVTRGTLTEASEGSIARRGRSLSLLPVCREFFGIPQIAIGEYDQNLLPDRIAASIEHVGANALTFWQDPRFARRLASSDASVIFLGGAFLEEEILIAALQGARDGYDIRLLSDLTIARLEPEGALALNRLTHHGVLPTTIRQALLEWAVSLGDEAVSLTVRRLLM